MTDFKYVYIGLGLLILGYKCMPNMNALEIKRSSRYEP